MSDGGAAPWINRVLVVIVAFIGLHAVFVLFDGNRRNGIVQFVGAVSRLLLLPFTGMFAGQSRLITCLIAAVGYSLIAGVALAVNSKVRAGLTRSRAGDRAGTEADVNTTRRV